MAFKATLGFFAALTITALLSAGSAWAEPVKLVGFGVWGRKQGGRNVTFPARQYSVNGERRSYCLLRPILDASSQDGLRDIILEAYTIHEAALAEAV